MSSTEPTCSRSSIEYVTSQLESSTLQEPRIVAAKPMHEEERGNIKGSSVNHHNKGVPGFPDFPQIWCGEEGGARTGSRAVGVGIGECRREKKKKCQQSSSQPAASMVVVKATASAIKRKSIRKRRSYKRQAVNVAGLYRFRNKNYKTRKQQIGRHEITMTNISAPTTTARRKSLLKHNTQVLCTRLSSLEINSTTTAATGLPTTDR